MGLDVDIAGSGPGLLFLHGESGLLFCRPLLQRLAEHFTVIAPSHPGWANAARTDADRSIDDLSYHYLDLLDGFDEPVCVVGCSLGAWLALEVAIKDRSGIRDLTLVSPVGIRTGEPTRRYYLDRYAVGASALSTALYGSPDGGPDLADYTDDDLVHLARAQEAAAFYTWEPYLHDPALLSRLHRVRRPVQIVTGARDGLVLAPEHVDTLVAALGGNVRTHVVATAGHQVEEQAPDELAGYVEAFAAEHLAAEHVASFTAARLPVDRAPATTAS